MSTFYRQLRRRSRRPADAQSLANQPPKVGFVEVDTTTSLALNKTKTPPRYPLSPPNSAYRIVLRADAVLETPSGFHTREAEFLLRVATRILLAITPIDMIKGFDGLCGLVSNHLVEDPRSGHLFVFTNNRRTRLKILFWDDSGLWVCSKRLERGHYRWPSAELCEADATTKMRLSTAALAMLLGGLDPVSVRARLWMRQNE